MHKKQQTYQKFLLHAPNCPLELYHALVQGKVVVKITYLNQSMIVYHLAEDLHAAQVHYKNVQDYAKGNKGLYTIRIYTNQDIFYY